MPWKHLTFCDIPDSTGTGLTKIKTVFGLVAVPIHPPTDVTEISSIMALNWGATLNANGLVVAVRVNGM